MCCRTLYSHPGGVVTVKNTLFAVKHGFAYALCCAPRRPWRSYITRRPCRWLYWEGKQRVEPVGIIFSRDDFSTQHQKLSFWAFGVAEEERKAIKLMNGRLMDFVPLLRRKTKDAHKVFFFMFQEFEEVTFDRWRRLLAHFHAQVIIVVVLIIVVVELFFYQASLTNVGDRRTVKLCIDIILSIQRSQKCRMRYY